MIQMLVNTTIVIILQYINVSNQHIVPLKFIQCYMSVISLFRKIFKRTIKMLCNYVHKIQKNSQHILCFQYYPDTKTWHIYMLCCAKSLYSCPTLLQSYGLEPNRLLCPWDFPGKNTGVGCHFLLHIYTMNINAKKRLTKMIKYKSEMFKKGYNMSKNILFQRC